MEVCKHCGCIRGDHTDDCYNWRTKKARKMNRSLFEEIWQPFKNIVVLILMSVFIVFLFMLLRMCIGFAFNIDDSISIYIAVFILTIGFLLDSFLKEFRKGGTGGKEDEA